MLTNFDIGNIYSAKTSANKTYYIAIRKQTLVTYRNGKFGKYTSKKRRHILENSISVGKLCDLWEIKTTEFDDYMSNYFSPDDEARARARKDKLDH